MDLVAIVLKAAYSDMDIDTRRALKIRPRRFASSAKQQVTNKILSALWARRSDSWTLCEKLRKLNNGTGSALASVTCGFLEDGSKVQDLSARCATRLSLCVLDNNGDVIMRIEKTKDGATYASSFTQCNVTTGAVVIESVFGDDLDDLIF